MLTSQIVAHAQSGYYQVAYTQGSITLSYGAFPSPQINQIDLVSPNLKRYNGSGVSYLIPTYPAFVQAKATLTGPIHVKLTWVPKYPGQPRPQAIIIEENCTVTAAGHAQSGVAVTSDNGLGDPGPPSNLKTID